MSRMRLARPSSAVHRPMSADVHMNVGSSRISAPFTVYNPKGNAKLPTRPHSSCEPGRYHHNSESRESHYDSLSTPATLDDIENIFEDVPSKSSMRTVRRRYLCNSLGGIDCSNTESPKSIPGPVMSYFDIKVHTDETKVDHLRMYYCDYFHASMADPLLTNNERTVEVDKMCNWLVSVAPRTRFDAYPLWALTKDMLRRFLSKEICLLDKEAKARELKIEAMAATILKHDQALKNSEFTLNAARAEVQHFTDLSDELDRTKAKCDALEKECANLQATIEQLSKQMDHQEQNFAKRMDAKILDVKAKVESIWEKQIESMRVQAEKARAEAESERAKSNECQEQFAILEKEHSALKSSVEEKERLESETMMNSNESFANNKATLASGDGDELLSYLEDLLRNGNVAKQMIRSSQIEENSKNHISSALQNGYDRGFSAEYMNEQLTQTEQWDLLRQLIRDRTMEQTRAETNSNDRESNVVPLLPILLQLALEYSPAQESLESLLFGKEDEVNELASNEVSLGLDSNNSKSMRPKQAKERDDRLGQVMKMLEQKKVDNEKLRSQIDELLKQLEDLRGGDSGTLQPLTGSYKRTNNSLNLNPAKIPSGERTVDNIVNFRPLCLRVYSIDDRLLKGKQAKALPVATLLNLIATAYEAKARADAIDDRKGNKRQHFPEFLRDFFLNKYGVRSLSFLNFKAFVMGVQQNLALTQEKFLENLRRQPKISDGIDLSELQLRLRLFGIVSGIQAAENWNDRLSDFMLGALGKLFSMDNLKESLEPKDQRGKLCVDLLLAIEATKEAWSKYGFDPASCSAMEAKILALAQKESGNLLLYEWMQCLMQEWLNASGVLDSQLRHLFAIHDADGNGTMDLEEFHSVLRDTTPELDESDMLRMFTEALAETAAMGDLGQSPNSDPDSIHPQAFSYVARRFLLVPKQLQAET